MIEAYALSRIAPGGVEVVRFDPTANQTCQADVSELAFSPWLALLSGCVGCSDAKQTAAEGECASLCADKGGCATESVTLTDDCLLDKYRCMDDLGRGTTNEVIWVEFGED